MATITVTPSLVRPLPGAHIERFIAGAALSVGDVVYLSAADTVQPARANAAATSLAVGIVVSGPYGRTSIAAGEAVDVCILGKVTGLSSATFNTTVYVSSGTAGKLDDTRPITGSYTFVVGRIVNPTTILVAPYSDSFIVVP